MQIESLSFLSGIGGVHLILNATDGDTDDILMFNWHRCAVSRSHIIRSAVHTHKSFPLQLENVVNTLFQQNITHAVTVHRIKL